MGTWVAPALCEPSLTGPDSLLLLNVPGTLHDIGWNGPQRELLWRYHQHYFDDLVAKGATERGAWHTALLQHWVQHNPTGHGTGWDPYPLSRRVVNWVKYALAGNTLPPECVHSFAIQARWLAPRLETHLLGNHLIANAKALVFAGLFFGGGEAEQWYRTGVHVLQRELERQLLPDGGHVERSPMYHVLVLEDVLDLANLCTAYAGPTNAVASNAPTPFPNTLRHVATRMVQWLRVMSHPDGEISLFNDAAFDVAPTNRELFAYAERLGVTTSDAGTVGSQHLEHSGYVRLEAGPAVAILDIAPVGPDYLPGHAHADTLSFELSVHGHRVLVNSGTSVYGTGAERQRQRGTAAHNTVVVNGENSSEVWSGFRVARRAYPRDAVVNLDGPELSTACSHDGYTRLPGAPVHRRTWVMRDTELVVEDHVTGQHVHAEARFHLHPAVAVSVADGNAQCATLRLPTGVNIAWQVEQGSVRVEPATWHPRFGESEPTSCLVVPVRNGRSAVRVAWGEAL